MAMGVAGQPKGLHHFNIDRLFHDGEPEALHVFRCLMGWALLVSVADAASQDGQGDHALFSFFGSVHAYGVQGLVGVG